MCRVIVCNISNTVMVSWIRLSLAIWFMIQRENRIWMRFKDKSSKLWHFRMKLLNKWHLKWRMSRTRMRRSKINCTLHLRGCRRSCWILSSPCSKHACSPACGCRTSRHSQMTSRHKMHSKQSYRKNPASQRCFPLCEEYK